MPLVIDGLTIRVSNSSKKANQVGSVRIYDAEGSVIAAVQMPRSDLLTYLRKNHASAEAQQLIVQLLGNDVPMGTVKKLLRPVPSKYELSRLMRSA